MKTSKDIFSFFDKDDFLFWKKEWQDMPEFNQEDKEPVKQIIVSFASFEDVEEFGKLINQKLTQKTQSIWFLKVKIETYMDKRYVTKNKNES